MIQLTLTTEEVNAILQVLGQLPTSSGAFPLLVKIKQQGEAQVPPVPADEGTVSVDEA
jgi:hypothetical protein